MLVIYVSHLCTLVEKAERQNEIRVLDAISWEID